MIGMIFTLAVILIMIIIAMALVSGTKSNERKMYNGGICPICGSKLVETVGSDENNGKKYMCENDKCSYFCYITTNIDVE